jgi:hypothetical protein
VVGFGLYGSIHGPSEYEVTIQLLHTGILALQSSIKGIVIRDFVVCFLVSFDRSEVSTHQEHLLLKLCFRVEFFDFRVSA